MDNHFFLPDENGTFKEYVLLAILDQNEKRYAIYTDSSLDLDNDTADLPIFASVMMQEAGHLSFIPIVAEAEWELIEDALNQLKERN